MELTIDQAATAFKILDAWVGFKKDSWEHNKLPLRVGRNMRKLSNELKEFNDRRDTLLKSAMVLGEDGKPVTKREKYIEDGEEKEKDTGVPVYENEAELVKKLNEMAQETITVDIHPIPESWFENDPPPSLLSFHADFLIEEDK